MQKKIKLAIVSILLVTIIIVMIIIKNNFHSKYSFTQDGIKYALTLDGNKITSFPSKGMYKVQVTCDGADGKWLYDDWKLTIENIISNNITCDIDFHTITKTNLNDYIISLAGTEQGTGQVVNETAILDNSTFTAGDKLDQSGYTISSNDATYPFEWDDTNKTWTSTNHTDSATSTIEFKVATAGSYQVCYKQSSEKNYDYTIFYKNNIQMKSLKGISNSVFECYFLGNLTISNVIKVTYQKDGSSSSGSDNVVFYLQSGTYNENIQTVSAGIRYEGKNPNNYVWFNNELWRIIGVFNNTTHGQSGKNLAKIIRTTSLGGYARNQAGVTTWSSSGLYKMLNNTYYNADNGTGNDYCYLTTGIKADCDFRTKGIQPGYRNMIASVNWFTDGPDESYYSPYKFYSLERNGSKVNGKVGLMYPSDYGYGVLSSVCSRINTFEEYLGSGCASQNWLYQYSLSWLNTQTTAKNPYYLHDYGSIYPVQTTYAYSVYPTVYLDSSVYFTSGNGSISSPYILGM